ncbi:MAG: class I SAM-dependent methyltransferase [Deltaproteobacteria bacterium]|nr:class I SAM-dependent methyltransferase [Deltaproteobacteria bacterium]
MARAPSSRISPTAHYTGYVWCRHGLSPAPLATVQGRAMFHALQGPMRLASLATGGVTLETMLLQRHAIIDHLLGRAIEQGGVSAVLELAAGLSGRGLRFATRYAGLDLVYVEGDLPAMAARKRRRLAALGSLPARHHVVAMDALAEAGPQCLAEAVRALVDPARGLAIVTEGLLSYLGRDELLGLWRRIARLLGRHPCGVYLSDLHLDDQAARLPAVRAFRRMLGVVTGGTIHLHFRDTAEVTAAWREAGGGGTQLHRPRALADELGLPLGRGADFVGVLEARVH